MNEPNLIPFSALNDLRDTCHALAIEKGWYDTEESQEFYIARTVANIHGEASELWEAFRTDTMNNPCDKTVAMTGLNIPELTCLEEELADIIIRVLDMAGRLNVDIALAVASKHLYNTHRSFRHGGKKA